MVMGRMSGPIRKARKLSPVPAVEQRFRRDQERLWLLLADFHHRLDEALKQFGVGTRAFERIPPELADVVFYGHDLDIWLPADRGGRETNAPEPLLWQHTKKAFQKIVRSQFGPYLCGFSSIVFLDHLRTDRPSFLHMELDCPTLGKEIHPSFVERSSRVLRDGLALTYLTLFTPVSGSAPGPEENLFPLVFLVSLETAGMPDRRPWGQTGVLQVSVSLQSARQYIENDNLPDWKDFPEPEFAVYPPPGTSSDILYSRVRQIYSELKERHEIRQRLGWNCAHHFLACREARNKRMRRLAIFYVPNLPVVGATAGVATLMDAEKIHGREAECMQRLLMIASAIGNSVHSVQQQLRYKAEGSLGMIDILSHEYRQLGAMLTQNGWMRPFPDVFRIGARSRQPAVKDEWGVVRLTRDCGEIRLDEMAVLPFADFGFALSGLLKLWTMGEGDGTIPFNPYDMDFASFAKACWHNALRRMVLLCLRKRDLWTWGDLVETRHLKHAIESIFAWNTCVRLDLDATFPRFDAVKEGVSPAPWICRILESIFFNYFRHGDPAGGIALVLGPGSESHSWVITASNRERRDSKELTSVVQKQFNLTKAISVMIVELLKLGDESLKSMAPGNGRGLPIVDLCARRLKGKMRVLQPTKTNPTFRIDVTVTLRPEEGRI